MGVSVYYTCERDNSLTTSEQDKIMSVMDRYNENFELEDIGETFSVYEYEQDQPSVIFEGSTKLPFSCLTEIRRSISNGHWYVHMDDIDAIWDEKIG